MEKEGQRELQVEGVLIPETPAKMALPRKQAICAAMQEEEPHQADGSESEDFPPGFFFPPGFAPRMEPDQRVQHQDSAGMAETTQVPLDDAKLSKINEELLAQHTHAATAATTAGHLFSLLPPAYEASTTAPRNEDAGIAPMDTFFCISSSNTEGDCSVPSSTASTDSKINACNYVRLNDNHYHVYPTDGQQNPKLLAYDLNLPAPTIEDVVLNVNPNFAPITPDKPLGKETRIALQLHDSVADQTTCKQNRQDIEANKEAIGELRTHRTKQSRNLSYYASLEEKDSTEKEDNSDMNMEKTPQKKPRRKKHRPKVVIEEKPKRTPKSAMPTTVASKGQTTGKRKYVRKKGLETSPASPVDLTRDSINLGITERPKRSCRRALNFNFDREEMGEINMCKYFSVLESQMHNQQIERIDSTVCTSQEWEANSVSRGKTHKEDRHTGDLQNDYMSTTGGLEPRNTTYLKSDKEKSLKEQTDFYCSKSSILTEQSSDHCEQAHNSINFNGVQYNSLQAYMALSWLNFPVEHKRKRSEKGQQPSSIFRAKTVNSWVMECKQGDNNNNTQSSASKANDFIGSSPPNIPVPAKDGQTQPPVKHKNQETGCIQKFRQAKRVKRERSRVPIRARNFASLIKIIESIKCSRKTMDDGLKKPQTCMEALLAQMHTLSRRKRTKKRLCLVTSAYSNAIKMQLHGTFNQSLNQRQWKHLLTVDAIAQQLEHLDINMETSKTALVPYKFLNQKDNTLVLYQREGTIVPFEGSFDPMKRRHPRPKVCLDEETTRVWKLLLENINNEGIDGTNEEKERWWKEERGVFKGRADSFIARMRLVQGDRRFSPWKGSVVDSVVGVFLTQNVSDHLSSSAFMSLAARFPYMSNQNKESDEGTSIITDEHEARILDIEHMKKWREEKTNATFYDGDSMIIHEMDQSGKREVDFSCKTSESTACIDLMNESNSHGLNSTRSVMEPFSHLFTEKSTVEIKRGVQANYDVMLSQNSVVSSQNSNDSSAPQNDERLELISQYSELKDSRHEPHCLGTKSLEVPTSFLQLLHMAGTNGLKGVYIHENDVSSNQNSRNALHHPVDCNEKRSKVEFSDATTSASSSIHDSNFQDDENTKYFSKEINCSERSNNGDCGPTTQDKIDLEEIFAEAPRGSIEIFHSWRNCPGKRDSDNTQTEAQGTFGRCECHDSHNMQQESDLQELPEQDEKGLYKVDISESINRGAEEYRNDGAIIDESNDINVKTSKTKTKNKEKEREIDWDNLRKQVEASGRRRERTPNTMDTVDWDAVRCTDINEIAETIKDRGMNNVLAGRIKDFLNRLVREHGSIDLEWLRDVAPDKAKEYLLSIRGLGLKSVECVRLLTLHHVAFPVDTNVGRIAVRLGWVPLQPLPESLQLHLLELYPVLESIQKYLWPRLCKLDQGTLYELHYQMITFGKVFCTKNKPNCNACPMRGECRHFASAFASARLALPGPEEKISANTVGRIESQESAEQLSLPFPQATTNSEGQQQDARPGLIDCQPIIEEPATPEPESIQTTENDIEDTFLDNSDEIPTIKLNMEEFTENLQNYMQQILDLEETEVSKALVALTPEAAAIPVPKLKNVSRLRTEHLVYELPEGHPLLNGLDNLEPDDPSKYLLAIWSPGETANSIQPPERRCNSQELGILCNDVSCFACNTTREASSQTVRGTFLIPCRTAMRGSFPLNGTYFQVNEVFADHETSVNPIDVPRSLLWKLPRRAVYFGTSIPSIFKGLTTEGIQHCFWRGYVCVRGFDRQTRAPRPLKARLHFPPSKLPRTKGKTAEE